MFSEKEGLVIHRLMFPVYDSAKSLQSCSTLCDPLDCSQPGSSVHGIVQARTLDWVATPPSRGPSRPRDRTCISYVSCTARQVLHQQHPLWQGLMDALCSMCLSPMFNSKQLKRTLVTQSKKEGLFGGSWAAQGGFPWRSYLRWPLLLISNTPKPFLFHRTYLVGSDLLYYSVISLPYETAHSGTAGTRPSLFALQTLGQRPAHTARSPVFVGPVSE